MNKALLSKWHWRLADTFDLLWKNVILCKYGKLDSGWSTKRPSGPIGTSIWYCTLKEKDLFVVDVGNGRGPPSGIRSGPPLTHLLLTFLLVSLDALMKLAGLLIWQSGNTVNWSGTYIREGNLKIGNVRKSLDYCIS